MVTYEFYLASSLEKVMPHLRPAAIAPHTRLSAWPGQKAALQLVYTAQNGDPNMPVQEYQVEVVGAPGPVRMRPVELIPVNLPCYENSDDDYISKFPGLFPDLLQEPEEVYLLPLSRQYRSLWLTFDIPSDAPAGDYAITVKALPCCHKYQPNGTYFHDPHAETQIFELPVTLHVGKVDLPVFLQQKLAA